MGQKFGQSARTENRPLASRRISPPQAIGFLALQLTAGLAVLFQMSWYSIALGASSLGLVLVYPLMKRITHCPQAVLGMAFNWGALLGWSAIAGVVDWTVCLPLYGGGIAWTLVYDTVYAHQDKDDDVKVGIRSTALLFGSNTVPILSALSVTSLGFVSLAGYLNSQGVPFYCGVGVAGWHLYQIIRRTEFDDRKSCWEGFVQCGSVGSWIWAGATLDYFSLLLF